MSRAELACASGTDDVPLAIKIAPDMTDEETATVAALLDGATGWTR